MSIAALKSVKGTLLSVLLKMYANSWRLNNKKIVEEYSSYKKEDKCHIIALWHNQLYPLIHYGSQLKLITIASLSKDGALITEIIRNWGYEVVRGSSGKTGAKALIELKNLAKQKNRDIAVTVDGPRGPKYKVKPGIVMLSKLTGFPIIPIFMSTKKFIQLKSWDRFILPMPFAKIDVIFTEPIIFSSDTSKIIIKEDTERLTTIMNERFYETNSSFL